MSGLNLRTLTIEELLVIYRTQHASPGIAFYEAVRAAFELVERFEKGSLTSTAAAEARYEDEAGKGYEHGHHEGQREMRDEVMDYLTDFLSVGAIAAKMESDIATQIIGRMVRQFPEQDEYKED